MDGSLCPEDPGRLGSKICRYSKHYVNITLGNGEKCTNVVWMEQKFTTSSTDVLERYGASK
jgi:hypothetical protein